MKKRINNHAKGKRIENYAKADLIKVGYLVETKNYSRFQSKDFYNLFDLLAIHKSTVRLIQIKSTASAFSLAKKEIRKWVAENNIKIPCEVWLFKGRMKSVNTWQIEEIK